MAKHVVIIGGPCAGKTSVIDLLKSKGYYTVSEAAREIITEQKKDANPILPHTNRSAFQDLMLKDQLKKWKEADKQILAIWDTGIPCGIAYSKAFSTNSISESLQLNAQKHKYSAVFLLELIDNYENDEIRRETQAQSERVHAELCKVYRNLGYNIISIPSLPVSQRVSLIEKHLKENGLI